MAQQPKRGGPANPAGVDTDQDGLSDAIERQLGTHVNKRDSDGDGFGDGWEVAWDGNSPRVRDLRVADPQDAARMEAEAVAKIEARLGVQHNADNDGDGFADWVEDVRISDPKVADLDAAAIKNNLSPLDRFMQAAESQTGKPYKFGAEADPYDPDGAASYDSSELVEWAAKQAGMENMPDGSWKQYQHLHDAGGKVTVEEALNTRGALVFGFSSDPLDATDRPARAYVGISLGNGKVLDVSERSGVVREMDPGTFYTHAAVIPQMHRPTGDFDGDGWKDREEIDAGGDPSRGITTLKPQPPATVPVEGDLDGDGYTDQEWLDQQDDPVVPRGSAPRLLDDDSDTEVMDPRHEGQEEPPPNDTDPMDPRPEGPEEPPANDTDLMDPRSSLVSSSSYDDSYSDETVASSDELDTYDDTYSDS